MPKYEVRCPTCHRMLCEVEGLGTTVTIKCPRCDALVQWPDPEATVIKHEGDRRKRQLIHET